MLFKQNLNAFKRGFNGSSGGFWGFFRNSSFLFFLSNKKGLIRSSPLFSMLPTSYVRKIPPNSYFFFVSLF